MNEHTQWQLATALPPDRVLAALIEFTDDRAHIWRETSHPDIYRVHAVGPTWADVTEGIPRAWSRERYEWHTPGVVELHQLDSNIATPGGLITYRIEATPTGSEVTCDRRRSLRPTAAGRLAATYMRVFGPFILRRQFAAGLSRAGLSRRN